MEDGEGEAPASSVSKESMNKGILQGKQQGDENNVMDSRQKSNITIIQYKRIPLTFSDAPQLAFLLSWPSELESLTDQQSPDAHQQCSDPFSSTVAQFTYPSMIGASSTSDLDHLDDFFNLCSNYESSQHQDLYDLLLHEPINSKRPSIHYDYTPASIVSAHSEPDSPLLEANKTSSTSSQTEVYVRKCTCSKTKCQKNYCECFKQGVVCSSACECLSCGNREQLFSARCSSDTQRCTCQKSRCLKNYCECHLNGRRCGPSCRCLDCENVDLPEDCLELSVSKGPSKRRKTSDPR